MYKNNISVTVARLSHHIEQGNWNITLKKRKIVSLYEHIYKLLRLGAILTVIGNSPFLNNIIQGVISFA